MMPSSTLNAMQKTTASICCYCGTGCGVIVHSQGDQVRDVTGDFKHPSSLGQLCGKGRSLATTVRRDDARVLHAQWRPGKGQALQPLLLEDACDKAAAKLAEVILGHGPDAVGFYLSGQLLTEDYAVFNKLARGLVGTNNIDTNSRLCMSSAVVAYQKTLGADAPPACYEDLDHADTVLIAGSNMAYAHPVLFRRLEAAKARRPDMKIIVIDPRRTETCAIADLHLAIAPGSDVALFHAMLNVLVWEGLIDERYIADHTEGFAALKARIHEYTPQAAQQICGVPADDIVRSARWFGKAGGALSLYTMGLNQSSSGTAKNAALIHLHLATGHIGKPGAGPFSLTGQPNAMGGREAGGMATLLPGHRNPGSADHRAQAAGLWKVAGLPETPGLTAIALFDAVLAGKTKVLWIAATNPAQSMPDQAKVRAALQKAEMVIVQEAYADTETLAYADLILPAATWPEKNGTVTNSERRISRVRAAIPPPGDALPDWQLAARIARRLAARIAPDKSHLFAPTTEAAIFAEHVRFTAGRDLDYSKLDYDILEAHGPQQWPYASPTRVPVRLYADGVFPTPNGKASFMDVAYTPPAESVSSRYPLRLTTGRLRDQWHTMSRSGLVPSLTRHAEEPVVHLHPGDMQRYRLNDDALVKIKTRRGEIVLPAKGDSGLKPGHAFLPMHWGSRFMAGEGVNALSNSARDPYSHQPELKHSAAGIEVLAYPWHASAWLRGDAAGIQRRLQPWLSRLPYAIVVPSGLGGGGVRLRLAAPAPASAATLAELIQDLGLEQADLAFNDPAKGVARRILREGSVMNAFLLAGDTRGADALLEWASSGVPPDNISAVLTGRSRLIKRDPIVCSCESVSEGAIQAAIAQGHDVPALQERLRCGITCGSCLPQIRLMIQNHARGSSHDALSIS
ncbi:MAG: molybdopterin-dependent oxidoreductase [Candidimonas sp.]|nr:molybdopterin-dependent oxidoreductase [Candidimonas sp.]